MAVIFKKIFDLFRKKDVIMKLYVRLGKWFPCRPDQSLDVYCCLVQASTHDPRCVIFTIFYQDSPDLRSQLHSHFLTFRLISNAISFIFRDLFSIQKMKKLTIWFILVLF